MKNNKIKLNKSSIKEIAKKVADDHKGNERPQLLKKVIPINKFKSLQGKCEVHNARVVRWERDNAKNTFTWKRIVIEVPIKLDFADHTTYPTMEEVELRINEQKKNWIEKGYFFSEEDAYNDLIMEIERALGHSKIDQEYYPKCPVCTYFMISELYNTMRRARIWIKNDVPAIRDSVDGECNVIPDENYTIVNRKWVKVKDTKCNKNCKKVKK